MKRIVDEVTASMPLASINQGQAVDEKTVEAIIITEQDGIPPPPDLAKFPWWLFGVGAVAAVAIRTKKIMKREKPS
jgi:hypothetical protein